MTPEIPFRRKVVEPVSCIKGGWELIRSQYWLFVGMTLVGVLIGGAVPIILMGPMMCGLNLAFLKTRRGEPIEFGTLFKGFDYFGQALIAALLHSIPVIVIVGNEVTGVDPGLLDLSDSIFHIPMQGGKKSFNVAIAFGIAAYQLK